MNKLFLILFTMPILLLSSCDFGLEDDECTATGAPLEPGDITVPTVFYRTYASYVLNYEPGTCETPAVTWTAGSFSETVPGTLASPGQSGIATVFAEDGSICAKVGSGSEACREVEVVDTDVWSWNQDYTYPGSTTNRTVVYSLGEYVYAGFGEVNEWYRFDMDTWTWQERSGPDVAAFEAYTGFKLDGKGYIFGQNSFLYEYDENSDSWTPISEFAERLDDTFELERQSNVNNAVSFLYPFVGAGIAGKGYIGVGSTGRFFEYDFTENKWTELSPYPEPGLQNANWFVWDDKIYLGKYYFDPASGAWKDAPNRYSDGNFDKYFVVMDDGVYFQNSTGTTRVFDGTGTVDYSPRALFPNERFNATGVAMVGVVGNEAIIPKSWQNQTKLANFTFYKRR